MVMSGRSVHLTTLFSWASYTVFCAFAFACSFNSIALWMTAITKKNHQMLRRSRYVRKPWRDIFTYYLLLITYYLLLITYHLLLITYYLSLITYYLLLIISPGRVAQSLTCLATDASLIADPGVASSIPARFHTFVEIDHGIISMVTLLPSAESFKKGCCQLQVKVCARSTG